MKNRKTFPILFGAAIMLCVTCSEKPATTNIVVTPIATPASALSVSSGEPNLCSTPDGGALLSWIESDSADTKTLRFSSWQHDHWSEARTVSKGSDWFVNWADFPAVALSSVGTMLASWLAKSAAGTYSYDIKLALSSDDGVSWSDPFSPHFDSTPTEHGFVSMLPLGDEGYAVSWLDGRETTEEGGTMTLRFATVKTDGSITGEALLDGKVCDCCQTSLCIAGDGSIVVVYRDRSDDEIRDISVVRRVGADWSEPMTVSDDGWQIDGCPVNGPAIAAEDSLVALSWFTTGSNDSARVLCAFSNDFGKSFGDPIRIDTGDPLGRVDILFADNSTILVSWLEHVGDTARVAVRGVRPDGVVSEAVTVSQSSSSRLSGFARMARTTDGILIAWTETTEPPIVRTARIRIE